MNATAFPRRVSRRRFLATTAAGAASLALAAAGCRRAGPETGEAEGTAGAETARAFEFAARVPRRLVLPAGAGTLPAALHLVAIEEAGASRVLFRFSNGQETSVESGTSYRSLLGEAGGKATREAVALKLLVAYAIEETGRQIAHRVAAAYREDRADESLPDLPGVLRELETFQRQEVLDVVSAGTLHQLVAAVDRSPTAFTRVSWDESEHRFVVRP